MNNKRYKLTISLLASNRKDTLPKTLESLKPILDNVSSELIVVDTGCDEDLVEVIKKYTDKVIKFKWIKDFSKARNVGIDNSSGEWFMFIDDDEWFEDATEIIEFFNSGEYKKFGFAKYVVRNYSNMEGTAWTDSVAGRMFKLFPNTQFVDAIHERPINVAAPIKNFSCYAHHYGYVYKSEAEKRAHLNRNISLLKEQIQKEPGNARHYGHLVQEYSTTKEYEMILKYAYEGIENADLTNAESRRQVVGLYAAIVLAMVNQARYEDVLSTVKEYSENPNINQLGQLTLCSYAAVSAYMIKDYEACFSYSKKHFEYVDFFKENPDERYIQDAIIIMNSLVEENVTRVATAGMIGAAYMDDLEQLYKFTSYIDFEKKVTIVDGEECMKRVVDMAVKHSSDIRMHEIVTMIQKNPSLFALVLKNIMLLEKTNLEDFYKAAASVEGLKINNGYVKYLHIINNRDNENIEYLIDLYRNFTVEVNDLIGVTNLFYQIADERGINLASIINEAPMDKWMDGVDAWIVGKKISEILTKKQELDRNLLGDGMHLKYFDMVLVEAFMYRKKLDDITYENIFEEILKFCETTLDFYARIYLEDIFMNYPTLLPKRCQAALLFIQVDELLKLSGERDDITSKLKSIDKLLPNASRITEKLLELLNMS